MNNNTLVKIKTATMIRTSFIQEYFYLSVAGLSSLDSSPKMIGCMESLALKLSPMPCCSCLSLTFGLQELQTDHASGHTCLKSYAKYVVSTDDNEAAWGESTWG